MEADFIASLTSAFPKYTTWLGMDQDTNQQRSGGANDQQLPNIKIDFKERDRLKDGANYDVWSIRMSGFLKEASLWGIVSGTVTRPLPTERAPGATRDPSPTPELKKWILLDERAQALIQTGLSEAMIMSTSAAKNAKEIWDTLQAVYHSRDMMSRMSASTRFYSLRMKEHEPIDQFIANFRLARLKLA